MFKDLKKGYQVYTLDTSGVPKFFMGTVVNVSEPRSVPAAARSGYGPYYRGGREVYDIRSSRESERGYGQRHYASLLRGSDNEPPERHETNQYGYRE